MEVWANPGSAWVAEFLGLGKVLPGRVVGKNKVLTEFGDFTIQCAQEHRKGDIVHLLVRPLSVGRDAEANMLHGVVTDVIFQREEFRVKLDNGLYVYLDEAPNVGQKISAPVKVECLI